MSDLLIAVVTMPMQLSSFVQNEWTAGQVPCKLTHYVQGVTIVVSILTLTAVAFDRSVVCLRNNNESSFTKRNNNSSKGFW